MAKATKKKATKKKATKRKGPRVSKRATATRKNGKPRASTQLHPLQLRGNLFLEYKAAMAEMFEARTRLKLMEHRLREELQDEKYAILLKIQNGRNDALRDVSEKQTAFKGVQARVCEKFGIEQDQLVHYTINETSGAIVFTPPKEEGDGASAETKP
jgi:hypothetical protein